MTHPNMNYIPTQPSPQVPRPSMGGAGKYHGDVARGYDKKRENTAKHILEQAIIQDMLADLPRGTVVFDCPVGTGRFLPYYVEKGFHILGMDLQKDMLEQAGKKVDHRKAVGELRIGDVRKTKLPGKSVDVCVNVRITRWLSPEDCQVMIREMQRIARQRIIFTARVANHPHARTIALFEEALDGWKITRNEVGSDMDYRVICLTPE